MLRKEHRDILGFDNGLALIMTNHYLKQCCIIISEIYTVYIVYIFHNCYRIKDQESISQMCDFTMKTWSLFEIPFTWSCSSL